MVKIRGYRVNPAELEVILRAHPDVEEAAVRPVEHARLGRVLHAFVTGSAPDRRRLQVHLRERVAPYMLPEKVHLLDAFPRTPNGKVDYAALT